MRTVQILIYEAYTGSFMFREQLKKFSPLTELDTRDLIKSEVVSESLLGKKIQDCLDQGELINTELLNELFHQHLQKSKNDIIVCNYPRNEIQKQYFLKSLEEFQLQIVAIWHLQLISSHHVAKHLIEKTREVEIKKYQVTEADILEKVRYSKASALELRNLWESDYEIFDLETDHDIEKDIRSYFTKKIEMYNKTL